MDFSCRLWSRLWCYHCQRVCSSCISFWSQFAAPYVTSYGWRLQRAEAWCTAQRHILQPWCALPGWDGGWPYPGPCCHTHGDPGPVHHKWSDKSFIWGQENAIFWHGPCSHQHSKRLVREPLQLWYSTCKCETGLPSSHKRRTRMPVLQMCVLCNKIVHQECLNYGFILYITYIHTYTFQFYMLLQPSSMHTYCHNELMFRDNYFTCNHYNIQTFKYIVNCYKW